jgi:hypothetical protein
LGLELSFLSDFVFNFTFYAWKHAGPKTLDKVKKEILKPARLLLEIRIQFK